MAEQYNTLTIDLPLSIDIDEAKFMIFASLFGKGSISSGKAATYLKMERVDFLEKVGVYGISIFSDEETDLENAMSISL